MRPHWCRGQAGQRALQGGRAPPLSGVRVGTHIQYMSYTYIKKKPYYFFRRCRAKGSITFIPDPWSQRPYRGVLTLPGGVLATCLFPPLRHAAAARSWPPWRPAKENQANPAINSCGDQPGRIEGTVSSGKRGSPPSYPVPGHETPVSPAKRLRAASSGWGRGGPSLVTPALPEVGHAAPAVCGAGAGTWGGASDGNRRLRLVPLSPGAGEAEGQPVPVVSP